MAWYECRVLWRNVSLFETYTRFVLTGFRHVARTGDIKQFVLIEESGIAKGIRRIVAVTGHEAHDVVRQAETFKSRLQQVEQSSGKAKDAGLKELSVVCLRLMNRCGVAHLYFKEIGQADISILVKSELKDRLTTLRKAFDKEVKEKEAATSKAVRHYPHRPRFCRMNISIRRSTLSFGTLKKSPTQQATLLSSMYKETPRSLVSCLFSSSRVPHTPRSQILQAVVLQAKKLGKAVYVFSVDTDAQKVAHVNHVPEAFRSKGVDARTWASKVTEILGGKVSA